MTKSEEATTQQRNSTKSSTEILKDDEKSKEKDGIKQNSSEENETNERDPSIKEIQSNRKSVVITDLDARSTSDLLDNDKTGSEENSKNLIFNASSEVESNPDEHSIEEIDNARNKGGCRNCVTEVFYCMSWYFGNIFNSIIKCFRRCASCSCFKRSNLRNTGEPEDNYAYFDDHRDAFSNFEEENIINIDQDDEIAVSVTHVPGTYKRVSSIINSTHETEKNVEVTTNINDTKTSPTKGLSDLEVVFNVKRDSDVKSTVTTDARLSNIHKDATDNSDIYQKCYDKFPNSASNATTYKSIHDENSIKDNYGNSHIETTHNITKNCSDFDTKDTSHGVSGNHTSVEHSQPSNFTDHCTAVDTHVGGSHHTGGGSDHTGGGSDHTGGGSDYTGGGSDYTGGDGGCDSGGGDCGGD